MTKNKTNMKKGIVGDSEGEQIDVMADANAHLQQADDLLKEYAYSIGFNQSIFPIVDDAVGNIRQAKSLLETAVNGLYDVQTIPVPYLASTKKSKMKKSDSQYRVYDESGEEYVGDKGTILNVVGNMLDGLDLPLVGRGSVTLTFECMGDSGYEASTKKSATKIDMSFEDNVNKMRQANYAKTGNINTIDKSRK